MRNLTRRPGAAALALGLAAALAACGSGRHDSGAQRDDVATIASGTAVASASPTAAERPLIRTDTSTEEEQRLWDEYLRCMEAHGADKRAQAAAEQGAQVVPGPATEPSVVAAAERACESKQPEQVWERAKRTDPQYSDKLRDWVTCIRANGIDAWEENGYLAFKSLPPDDQMKKVDECQDKAFGKG